MPWKVFTDGSQHCVHKLNADGSKGERVKCFMSEKEATDHMKALYANTKEGMTMMKQIGGSIDDFLSRVRSAFESQFNKGKQPDQWLWVRDVFEHHVIAREADQYWQIGMKVGDAVTFDPRNQWKAVTLDYVAQMDGEQRGPIHEVMITEFKGKFPDVPTRPEIDMNKLTKGDDDPFIMTLRVSQVGKESKSGLLHDDSLASSIAEQVNTQATTGIMGHLRDEDRGTAYPVADIHWLGAVYQDGATWAKGYIPKTKEQVREHYRILMETGGKAATSIYGAGIKQMVDKKRGTYRLKEFRLEQLDLAPIERAALPLDSGFQITKQMQDQDPEEITEMDREQLIAELKASDIPVLLREQIIQEWQSSQGDADRIKQMETENASLKAENEKYRVAEFAAALDGKIAEMVTFDAKSEEAKKKLSALRANVRRVVVAELAGKTDMGNAEKAISEYVGSDEYKALAEAVVVELAGPPSRISSKNNGTDNWRDELAKRSKDLKKEAGV